MKGIIGNAIKYILNWFRVWIAKKILGDAGKEAVKQELKNYQEELVRLDNKLHQEAQESLDKKKEDFNKLSDEEKVKHRADRMKSKY